VDRLGAWAVENEIKINPSKSKAVRFTKTRVKNPINYSLMDTQIPEASSCKYLGTQRLRLGRSSQLHGEKGLESAAFHYANSNKG
jgi:hypothetical protein